MTRVFARQHAGRLPSSLIGRSARWIGASLMVVLVACSQTLDWRQVRPDGWSLVLALPCRPDKHVRSVPLAGSVVELGMLVCQADGHTFAVSSADMAEPTRVEPALVALGAAARANVRAQVESAQAASVPGMTPHPAAQFWRLRGQSPEGQPVREQVLVFAHGLRVYQATVLGPEADDARARPFFDSITVSR